MTYCVSPLCWNSLNELHFNEAEQSLRKEVLRSLLSSIRFLAGGFGPKHFILDLRSLRLHLFFFAHQHRREAGRRQRHEGLQRHHLHLRSDWLR